MQNNPPEYRYRLRAVEQHQHLGCVLCSLMYCYVAARAKARPQAIPVFRLFFLSPAGLELY